MKRLERWRDVVGFEGLYRVSDLGRIKSLDRVVTHARGDTQLRKGRIRRPAPGGPTRPHLGLDLYKGGVATKVLVHLVVAAAWLGPCPPGCEVCHGPGGQTDNSVGNLRYDTHANNIREACDDNHAQTRCVRRSDGREFVSVSEARRCTPNTGNHISAVCSGKRKSAGGYGWSYCNEENDNDA